jgi:hypothetical protein
MHSHPYLIQLAAAAEVDDKRRTAQRIRLADEAVGRRLRTPRRTLARPGRPPGEPDRVSLRSTLRLRTAGHDCR